MKRIELNIRKTLLSILVCMTAMQTITVHAQTESSKTSNLVQMTVDKDVSVYQFAMQNQLTVDELLQVNSNLKVSDTLTKGSLVNLPNGLVAKGVLVQEETSLLLPELSKNAGSTNNNLLASGLSYVPGTNLLTGSTEENTASLAVAAAEEDWKNIDPQAIIDDAKKQAISKVTGAVNGKINQQVDNFLGRFGKAEANISIDADGNVSNSDLKVLSPLYDQKESLLFSQVGVHKQDSGQDSRLIGNFGIGYRYETNAWLAGVNTFIDHDFTGENTRLGIGGEFWADNYKIAANTYTPLSNWKESKVMKNHEALIYDERPAQGFDIRAKAFLPSYPQLGGSLVYEQYFGDDVALFGINERQKNPYGLSLGIDYMPIPLLKTELTHKIGKSGADETKFNVSMNLQLGTPIEEQLNPDNVAAARSLKGSRYDMVDRNYDIVFEYKKENFSITIDGDKEATFGQTVNIKSTVQSRSPIKSYEWTVTDILGNPLQIISQNSAAITFNINDTVDHYVRVKVVTERGYEAVSNVHRITYKNSVSQSMLVGDAEAEVINFANYPLLDSLTKVELDKIDAAHKAQLVFTAIAQDGQGFDLSQNPDVVLLWKLPTDREYKVSSTTDLVKVFAFPIEGETNKLQIIVVADSAFIPEAGNKIVDIAVVSKLNPTVTAQAQVRFTRFDDQLTPNGIDPQNLIIQVWEVPGQTTGAARAFATSSNLVSESGFINGKAIPVVKNPIKPNTEYRVKILTIVDPIDNRDDMVDVTDRYIDSVVWLYWDPLAEKEITANSDNRYVLPNTDKAYNALEGCRASPIFITQVNNYDFNELSWGEILRDDQQLPRAQQTTTEQGLRLAVQFDFRELNEANPIVNECKPEYEADQSYVGYVKNTDIKKVGLWSESE